MGVHGRHWVEVELMGGIGLRLVSTYNISPHPLALTFFQSSTLSMQMLLLVQLSQEPFQCSILSMQTLLLAQLSQELTRRTEELDSQLVSKLRHCQR